MKKLLIINKKINFLEKKKILFYSRIKEVIILDINYDINKKFYKNSKISSNIINYGFFLEKNFQKIKVLYEKKISLFLKKNPEYILFKFSEINFSDFWWKLIVNVESINIFCKKNNISEVEVIEKSSSYLSQSLFSQKEKNYFVKKKINLNFILYIIYLKKIRYANLLKEIIIKILFSNLNKKKLIKKKNFIYSGFPHGWSFFKKNYNRFLGKKISKNSIYLFSITRNNEYKLNFDINFSNRLNIIKNYRILESFGSITNILKNYFFLSNDKKSIFKNLNILFKNNFISKILTYGIIYIEIPKNKIFSHNLFQFIKHNEIKKIIHPIPEFIDGRIINKIFNDHKVKTYAVQHSSIGVLQSSRFISMAIILNRINKKFISKKIFVENHFIKKQLKEISSHIKVVGNIRIKRQKITKRVNKNNIYYISEMHNLNLLNYKIQKILYTFKEKNLFIRLHPGKLSIQAKIVSKNIDYNKRLFVDNTSSIIKAIQHIKPSLVFTSTPTVYNELITNKIRAILIKDSSFYTNYPLEIDHKKIFSTTDFNIKKYKWRPHKVPTKYFDKISEYKIYNYFNE